jgi:ATP-dependent Clp protease ATP-binding subunit ClpA
VQADNLFGRLESAALMHRFTDNARAAVRHGFRRRFIADERDILAALAARRRGLAAVVLRAAGVGPSDLPAGLSLERRDLVTTATEVARQRGTNHVGTEHLLLALASRPGSALAQRGATGERLSALLSVATAEWRQAHPPVARRIGAWCRSAWQWVRS